MHEHFRRIHHHHSPTRRKQQGTYIVEHGTLARRQTRGRIGPGRVAPLYEHALALHEYAVVRKYLLPHGNGAVEQRRARLAARLARGRRKLASYQVEHLLVHQQRHQAVEGARDVAAEEAALAAARLVEAVDAARRRVGTGVVVERAQRRQAVGAATQVGRHAGGKARLARAVGTHNQQAPHLRVEFRRATSAPWRQLYDVCHGFHAVNIQLFSVRRSVAVRFFA